jgi:GNAT superfamily N-acetyltransferase
MLEAENDPEIFHALLGAAEGWLHEQEILRIRGPFNLSINQECGLLVEGFDTPPMIMMGHSRPYYAERILAEGYRGAKDLLAYRVASDFETPEFMRTVLSKTAGYARVRALRRSHLAAELEILREIFEDSWSTNWGFIPFTVEEFRYLGYGLRLLVDDECVQIAEVDGVPAGMIVVFPNLNEAIRDLDGRLLPFGWIKLLWRLKVKFPRTARVSLMGVRKRFQGSALGSAIAFLLIDAVRAHGLRRGVQEVELSWILEDNAPMLNMLAIIGAVPYKRYRIYEKALT